MMTQRHPDDLTRWNRAGLERFRYVGANAVTLLETLRVGLAAEFPEWDYVAAAEAGIPADESDAERLHRLLDRYRDHRQDWGWEIARAFARAAHLVTEHSNAFANEGYIGTATQWDFLRRLVAMLDYRPLPPASAATTLALEAKPDGLPGTVAAGFQVKFSPPDGGPPLIFETLDDIVIDPALNVLHLKSWNRNPNTFNPFDPPGNHSHWLIGENVEVSVGQPALLVRDPKEGNVTAAAVLIDAVYEEKLALARMTTQPEPGSGINILQKSPYILSDTHLLIEPKDVRRVALNGINVVRVPPDTGLTAGQVIGWTRGDTNGFARIVVSDRFGIAVTDIRPAGEDISGGDVTLFRALRHDGQIIESREGWVIETDHEFRFTVGSTADLVLIGTNPDGSLSASIIDDPQFFEGPDDIDQGFERLDFSGSSLFYFDPTADSLTLSEAPPPGTDIDLEGGPGGIASGDWMVAESPNGTMAAVRVVSVRERENSFTLVLDQMPETLSSISRLHGPFATTLRPGGFDRNPHQVTAADLVLETALVDLPASLSAGRTVLVDTIVPAPPATPFAARIASIVKPDSPDASPRLVLDATPGKFTGFEIGNIVIRANAVTAGHGEAKPVTTLGSGDAARIGQSFALAKEGVSFVADPTLETGVRAAITLRVDGRLYEEVSTLANSEAHDAHYTTEMTEEGHVRLRFGDGMHGRRLPTGRSNIRADYRTGTGAKGNNLPPASLEKPVKPHPLVEAVHQPVATTGGQDMEDLAGIRANAPSHLHTLGRGVSLRDFEHLARNQPGIWHANAFHALGAFDRREIVELAVVPVDNAPLGDLGVQLERRLATLAPPGITFHVSPFDPAALDLSLRLRIDTSQYDADVVAADVRAAIYAILALERRAPGQPLYLSEIYAVTENITGVHSSDASLFAGQTDTITSRSGAPLHTSRNGSGQIWALWPTGRQAVFITEPAAISISQEELSL